MKTMDNTDRRGGARFGLRRHRLPMQMWIMCSQLLITTMVMTMIPFMGTANNQQQRAASCGFATASTLKTVVVDRSKLARRHEHPTAFQIPQSTSSKAATKEAERPSQTGDSHHLRLVGDMRVSRIINSAEPTADSQGRPRTSNAASGASITEFLSSVASDRTLLGGAPGIEQQEDGSYLAPQAKIGLFGLNLVPVSVTRLYRTLLPSNQPIADERNERNKGIQIRVAVENTHIKVEKPADQRNDNRKKKRSTEQHSDDVSSQGNQKFSFAEMLKGSNIVGGSLVTATPRYHHAESFARDDDNSNIANAINNQHQHQPDSWEVSVDLQLEVQLQIPKSIPLPPGLRTLGKRALQRQCRTHGEDLLDEITDAFRDWEREHYHRSGSASTDAALVSRKVPQRTQPLSQICGAVF
mmetsp:Transcript_23445/g.65454  ORF Transcript_23445/g.65454 Transcript_23445/m.65454 type:complete len:412 (-) Transcript_23445:132-1367(-)